MPMTKGVEGPLQAKPPSPLDPGASTREAGLVEERGGRMVRRRRKNRNRHQHLSGRSSRTVEIASVTVLALGVLFAVLYYLLSHDPSQNRGEESRLGPRTSPAHRAVISPRAAGPS